MKLMTKKKMKKKKNAKFLTVMQLECLNGVCPGLNTSPRQQFITLVFSENSMLWLLKREWNPSNRQN